MATTQSGTSGLTVGGLLTAADAILTIPAGCIVESCNVTPGGDVQFQDYFDEDGAFHTRITFEASMDKATIVIVGKAYTVAPGALDGQYYVESAPVEYSKGPIRTTITVTKLPTVA